jgi:hypothetical protein
VRLLRSGVNDPVLETIRLGYAIRYRQRWPSR